MNINLGRFKEFVHASVESGRYFSAAEAIQHGLRLLEEDEKWRCEEQTKVVEGTSEHRDSNRMDGEESMGKHDDAQLYYVNQLFRYRE